MKQVEETYLKQLVRARDVLPYKRFVRVYEKTARDLELRGLSVERRQYLRWLAGEVKGLPLPDACAVLQAMFGQPADKLFTKVPVQVNFPASEPNPEVIDLSPRRGAVWSTPQPSAGPDPRAVPATLHELMMSAAEQSRDSAANAETALGRSTLELLEGDVITLARTYLSQSPVVMFPKISELRTRVEAKTRQSRQPDQLRDLSFMNGVLCALLAEASNDLGMHHMANDHARAAWVHANNIGHVPLAVWARGMQATSAYWNNAPNDALVAISRAEEHRPTGVPAARLNSIRARTWSHLGNTERTLQAVRDAQEARATAPDDEHDDLAYVGGVFDWDRVREERCASTAVLELIRRRHAELDQRALQRLTNLILDHADRARTMSQAEPAEKRSPIVEATILLDMATARLLLGDVSGAHDTLRPIFSLPGDMRTFPVLHRLRGIRAPLAQIQTTRAVQELAEALRDFNAGSTVRALPPGTS
ncbi:hypothetical protein [Sphaerisporangium sp. NPDC051011]|uniref:hypothetical protein n=1 Tax=Sphaerisporangium sp. NPDC051011 TaxID=3155792 RepID=UPI0034119A7D